MIAGISVRSQEKLATASRLQDATTESDAVKRMVAREG